MTRLYFLTVSFCLMGLQLFAQSDSSSSKGFLSNQTWMAILVGLIVGIVGKTLLNRRKKKE